MKTRTLVVPVLVLLIGYVGWSQDKKARDWQSGRLLALEKTRELESTTTNTNTEGKVKSGNKGDKYSEQSTATETPNYENYVTYTVEAGDFTYTAKQHLLFPWSKPANVAVGGNLKYAVVKDKLYLLDDDGKESSAKIIKKAVKGTQ
jgi:uncharacterized GH25 family protein